MLRGLFWLCKTLNKSPKALSTKESVELCKQVVIDAKKGIHKRGIEPLQTEIRSWYLFIGVSGSFLTSKGITGERRGRGQRATVRLSEKQRHRFLECVKGHYDEDYQLKNNGHIIPFLTEPKLKDAMSCCVKFLYYTGTRRTATINARWDQVTWDESGDLAQVTVIDKGKHKLGRLKWNKRLMGQFLEEFKAHWQSLGCPDEGLIFPFDKNALTGFFNDCFEEAEIQERIWKKIPVHIWRHTACQDMLEATDYNWELVAQTLGWQSIDTMKKHYGKVPEPVIRRGLRKAMGLPIEEKEKKEFRF